VLGKIGFALIDWNLLNAPTHSDEHQRGCKKQKYKTEKNVPSLTDNVDGKKFNVGEKSGQKHKKE
jgi:hypothetical protein